MQGKQLLTFFFEVSRTPDPLSNQSGKFPDMSGFIGEEGSQTTIPTSKTKAALISKFFANACTRFRLREISHTYLEEQSVVLERFKRGKVTTATENSFIDTQAIEPLVLIQMMMT
jgi:hypothetical protein